MTFYFDPILASYLTRNGVNNERIKISLFPCSAELAFVFYDALSYSVRPPIFDVGLPACERIG